MTYVERDAFLLKYREFCRTRFPQLGYAVDGLPEADGVLAGLVSQLAVPGRRIVVDSQLIISTEMVNAALSICDTRRESPEAIELEAYVRQLVELERGMRDILSHEK